jgi:hypothetical protein
MNYLPRIKYLLPVAIMTLIGLKFLNRKRNTYG